MVTFKDKSISTLSNLSKKLVDQHQKEVEFVSLLFEKVYKEYLNYFKPLEGKNVYIEFKRKNGRTQVDEWYGFYFIYEEGILTIYSDVAQSSRSRYEVRVHFTSSLFKRGTFSRHCTLTDESHTLNRLYKDKSFLWFAYREPEELFSQLRIGLIDATKSVCIEKNISIEA